MDYNLIKTLHGLFRRSPKPFHDMAGPALRVVVDGDSDKVYRKGDKVSGRVILAVEEEERIDSLRIVFAGNCITQTTRPFHVTGGDDSPARREYEEKIRLFDQTKELASATTLEREKYTWAFEFTFPGTTDPRYKRLTHGGNYLREPHALPPTFQLKTNVPGGAAQISYFVQARLSLSGGRGIKRCRQLLQYHPTSANALQREAKCTSSVLYGQTWKPNRNSKPTKGVFSKVSRRASLNTPRIIPSILYPESIAPGQHIPVSLSVRNSKDALNESQGECMIDSLSITISTYSTTMCGHSMTQPEDIVSKHVTCIARVDMNKPIAFNETKQLTSNFRLVDDAECVPTFKTYTITRRYALGISVGMKYGDEHFTIRSNTPLEILPRVPRDLRSPRYDDTEDYDPLPLYEPREPSKEFAPDYEEIFALSRTPSSVNTLALSRTWSSSASSASDGEAASSVASSVASTPASEVGQVAFERQMIRGT